MSYRRLVEGVLHALCLPGAQSMSNSTSIRKFQKLRAKIIISVLYIDIMLCSLLNMFKSTVSSDPPNDPEQLPVPGSKNKSVTIATILLTACYMPGTVLSTLHPSPHLMLSTALGDKYITDPVLQVRNPKLRKMVQLAQASKRQSQDSSSGLSGSKAWTFRNRCVLLSVVF